MYRKPLVLYQKQPIRTVGRVDFCVLNLIVSSLWLQVVALINQRLWTVLSMLYQALQ